MMRKIFIPLLLMIALSTSVLADWGATRSITGNDVTITVSPGDGFDEFTITESVKSAVIVDNSWSGSCGLANNQLTCDFEGTTAGTISYQTTGTGAADGTIFGVKSADSTSLTSQPIAGDTKITALKQCVNIYQDKDADGYGKPGDFKEICDQAVPTGFVTDNTDCDDSNPDKWRNRYYDGDGDGYASSTSPTCVGNEENYYDSVTDSYDCKDNDADVHPDATELCNNEEDDNCNGQTDEGSMTDPNNCDSCGFVCPAENICSAGICVSEQQQTQQQALDAVLTAIRSILESEDQPLDKLSSIAAQLFSYFSQQ